VRGPDGGTREVLEYHVQPQPDTCDVCKYAVEYDSDCAYEHARARVATAFLLEDLQELAPGETTKLDSVAVVSTGVEPGPVHALDPRHWFWAMYYEPVIRLSLRR
jgi:hypothetical protein